MCRHNFCKYIIQQRQQQGFRPDCGVGVLPIVNYNGQGRIAVMLGKERGGDYRNQFNLCGGGMEPEDAGCILNAALRELREEFKIEVNWSNFDQFFKYPFGGQFRYIIHRGTVILVGDFQGLSRVPINQNIQACNSNQSLPWKLREIEQVDWFWMDDQSQIDEKQGCVISSYASSVIRKIENDF